MLQIYLFKAYIYIFFIYIFMIIYVCTRTYIYIWSFWITAPFTVPQPWWETGIPTPRVCKFCTPGFWDSSMLLSWNLETMFWRHVTYLATILHLLLGQKSMVWNVMKKNVQSARWFISTIFLCCALKLFTNLMFTKLNPSLDKSL